MNNTFRNALMVKVGDFLAQNKIFQQRWTTATGAQGVLIIGDAYALVGGKCIIFTAFTHVLQGVQLFITCIWGFQTPWRGWLRSRWGRFS